MKIRISLLAAAALAIALAPLARAQDPVKADPKHYKVVTENDQVRVLRSHYGPHEKSVMHSHPNTVAVFLTDSSVKFTYPDGKTENANAKAGDAQYRAAAVHDPENTGDKPMEVIVVELKGKGAAAAKPAAAAEGKKEAKKTEKK